MLWVGLLCVTVIFPDHTHLLFEGDTEVRVLRDTVCELAAVRKDMVSQDQMLDKIV